MSSANNRDISASAENEQLRRYFLFLAQNTLELQRSYTQNTFLKKNIKVHFPDSKELARWKVYYFRHELIADRKSAKMLRTQKTFIRTGMSLFLFLSRWKYISTKNYHLMTLATISGQHYKIKYFPIKSPWNMTDLGWYSESRVTSAWR